MLIASATDRSSEKPEAQIGIDIRLCKECKAILFDKRDFAEELLKKPPDTRAYEILIEFERGIRLLLPKFQKLLIALQYVAVLPFTFHC